MVITTENIDPTNNGRLGKREANPKQIRLCSKYKQIWSYRQVYVLVRFTIPPCDALSTKIEQPLVAMLLTQGINNEDVVKIGFTHMLMFIFNSLTVATLVKCERDLRNLTYSFVTYTIHKFL